MCRFAVKGTLHALPDRVIHRLRQAAHAPLCWTVLPITIEPWRARAFPVVMIRLTAVPSTASAVAGGYVSINCKWRT